MDPKHENTSWTLTAEESWLPVELKNELELSVGGYCDIYRKVRNRNYLLGRSEVFWSTLYYTQLPLAPNELQMTAHQISKGSKTTKKMINLNLFFHLFVSTDRKWVAYRPVRSGPLSNAFGAFNLSKCGFLCSEWRLITFRSQTGRRKLHACVSLSEKCELWTHLFSGFMGVASGCPWHPEAFWLSADIQQKNSCFILKELALAMLLTTSAPQTEFSISVCHSIKEELLRTYMSGNIHF